MITDAIVNWALGLLTSMFAALPTWAPLDFSGWVSDLTCNGATATDCYGIGANSVNGGLFHAFSWLNWYVPIDQAVFALEFAVGALAGLYTFKITLWILGKLHVTGSGGS